MGKGCDADYPDSAGDSAPLHTEDIGNGIDHPDVGCLVFDPQCELDDLSKEEPMSEERLRECLKKQLEFCFSRWVVTRLNGMYIFTQPQELYCGMKQCITLDSIRGMVFSCVFYRENLYKDLYLMSQMDSDQFVPIWTVACMEHIKSLTTDVDLIRQVLQGISTFLNCVCVTLYAVLQIDSYAAATHYEGKWGSLQFWWKLVYFFPCSLSHGGGWWNWREGSS